jgi:hypothetical protein
MEKENSIVSNVLFSCSVLTSVGALFNYHNGFNGGGELGETLSMIAGHYYMASTIGLVFMGTLLNYVKWIADATELSVSKQKQAKVKNSGEINEPLGWVEKMLINED